jgi:hypothetical protein
MHMYDNFNEYDNNDGPMLYLPFFIELAAQKSSAAIFRSPTFASTVGSQLLVFSANEPRFLYSQQPSNTNR